MTSIAESVRDIIATELQIDRNRVVRGARLRKDLGMDSIAALNIMFAAQETFGIGAIEDTEILKVQTVADVEALVGRLTERGH